MAQHGIIHIMPETYQHMGKEWYQLHASTWHAAVSSTAMTWHDMPQHVPI